MKSYQELEFCIFEPKFVKFYRENYKRKYSCKYQYKGESNKKSVDSDKSFYISIRTIKDGIHIDNTSNDYKWNIYKNLDLCIMGKGTHGFIFFNTKQEKDNFTEFWYHNGKSGLMHKLIKGLNKSSGTLELAIPRVDWTKKWTDREILAEFGYTEEEINEILC